MAKRENIPQFSVEHLQRILREIKKSGTLPPTPLRQFEIVLAKLEPMPDIDPALAQEFILTQALNDLIAEQLAAQRQQYTLPPPDTSTPPQTALYELGMDFRQDSESLEAWSLLYYRYVRLDLSLTPDQLEEITLHTQRTLNRREKTAIKKLSDEIVRQETRRRRQKRRDRYHRLLPPLLNGPPIGRDSLLRHIMARLHADAAAPRHIVLVGPGGIGKTLLAAFTAHQLVNAVDFTGAAWVTAPVGLPARELPLLFLEALGLPARRPEALRSYCQTHDVLLILDEAENLANGHPIGETLMPLLETAAEAHLIITSRVNPRLSTPTLSVNELHSTAAADLIRARWPVDVQLREHQTQAILQYTGGNPLAIEVATRLAASTPDDTLAQKPLFAALFSREAEAVLNDLHDYAWHVLDGLAQQTWLGAWLLPSSHTDLEMLSISAGLDQQQIADALRKLVDFSLLTLTPQQRRVVMHSVTRLYLSQEIEQDRDLRRWVKAGADRLVHADSPAVHLPAVVHHLLTLAEKLQWPITRQITIIASAWTHIMKQGRWVAWRPLLEILVDQAEAERDSQSLARAALWLGITCRWVGDFHGAEHALQQTLHHTPKHKNPTHYAQTLTELAVVYRYQQRGQSAQQTLRLAQNIFEQIDDPGGITRCRVEQAQLWLDAGDAEAVIAALEPLATSARIAGLLADAHLVLDNLREANHWAEIALADTVHDASNHARAQAMVGRVRLALGRLDEAEDYLTTAVEAMDQNYDLLGWGRAAASLAEIYRIKGNVPAAQELLEAAADQQRVLQDEYGLATTLQLTLKLYLDITEAQEAAGAPDTAASQTSVIERLYEEWAVLQRRQE